jgi:hypothetical protein
MEFAATTEHVSPVKKGGRARKKSTPIVLADNDRSCTRRQSKLDGHMPPPVALLVPRTRKKSKKEPPLLQIFPLLRLRLILHPVTMLLFLRMCLLLIRVLLSVHTLQYQFHRRLVVCWRFLLKKLQFRSLWLFQGRRLLQRMVPNDSGSRSFFMK